MCIKNVCTLAVAVAFTAIALSAPRASRAQPLPNVSFARPEWTTEASFSEITSIRVLANGTVVLADAQESQVFLISATGKSAAPIGRKGSGPAEYQSPNRLIALANDTTLVVDRDARRFLLVDGRGRVIGTHQFPEPLADGAEQMMGADGGGRLYFRVSIASEKPGTQAVAAIGRWQRGMERFDTVTMIAIENPKVQQYKNRAFVKGQSWGQPRTLFAPVDDWVVAPSGRIAIIHAVPYRVDWLEKHGTMNKGAPVTYSPVPVAEQDKKLREPKGPPYVRLYAKMKAAFMPESAVADEADNIWVPRNEVAGAASRRWDVFSSTGKHLGAVPIPGNRRLLAVTERHAYLSRTDEDGLRWLERYAR